MIARSPVLVFGAGISPPQPPASLPPPLARPPSLVRGITAAATIAPTIRTATLSLFEFFTPGHVTRSVPARLTAYRSALPGLLPGPERHSRHVCRSIDAVSITDTDH